jgi:ABC-type phosphate/phosphonate transport system substrate-binding protein
MINPAGISSEANFREMKFCVQTEFAPRPKPRITTSVSLNGEMVQKVEKFWEKLPQSEEDKDEIERFLRKQHQEVIKNIKEKEEKFVSSKDEAKGLLSL